MYEKCNPYHVVQVKVYIILVNLININSVYSITLTILHQYLHITKNSLKNDIFQLFFYLLINQTNYSMIIVLIWFNFKCVKLKKLLLCHQVLFQMTWMFAQNYMMYDRDIFNSLPLDTWKKGFFFKLWPKIKLNIWL